MPLSPVPKHQNTPRRSYRGGRGIPTFRGEPTGADFEERGPDLAAHGMQILTPYTCGVVTLTGDVTAIRCRPGRDIHETSGAAAPTSTIQHLEERP